MDDMKHHAEREISKIIGKGPLTKNSLTSFIKNFSLLPDQKKREINRRIALSLLQDHKEALGIIEPPALFKQPTGEDLKKIMVLAVNHASPLDITLEWTKVPDGKVSLTGAHVDAGGDQINVSKVFGNFGENISLISLSGDKNDPLTMEWKNNFIVPSIMPRFIELAKKEQQVQVYNVLDGLNLPPMHGWEDPLALETIARMNAEVLSSLNHMLENNSKTVWMVLSTGGPLRYDPHAEYYGSLVKKVKDSLGDKARLLIDPKYMSGTEGLLPILNLPRETPQDIIKPNIEEFLQILISSRLIEPYAANEKHRMTVSEIKGYALKLRKKYGLLGVLVSMDSSGLVLALPDRIITEKGIKIYPGCQTAAGDSLKAGFVYSLSRGGSFEEAVHMGNLFGAATASMEGSKTVTPEKLTETETLARQQKISPEIEVLA